MGDQVVSYMGIDIGSSGCKALVVDRDGRQLALGRRDYDVAYSKDGSATLDSDEVIGKCLEVIRECSTLVKSDPVRSIGISSQGEAFTAVDETGETLTRAQVSSDSSAGGLIEDWISKFGEKRLYEITGHTAHPMFTLFKLLWLKNNRKDIWRKARRFLCFEDLLQLRLGLEPAISWSLAGRTMMFDVRKHAWDQGILEAIGITPARLASPRRSGSISGTISRKTAAELGLTENVSIVTGGHDQNCSALGAGVVDEGAAMLGTGTVECVCPALKSPVFSNDLMKNNLSTYNYTVGDFYTTVAFSLTGGNILTWFKEQFGYMETEEAKSRGKDAYDLLLADLNPSPSELLVLPYFTPSGTPYFDSRTRGAILGLRISTQRKEIMKGLLEGVSLEMRLNLDILQKAGCEINELRWVGGGSKSRPLAQLKANAMNKKITLMNVNEAGCLGAAMLACSADTEGDVAKLASLWVKESETVYPQPEYSERFEEKFGVYKNLYRKIREVVF